MPRLEGRLGGRLEPGQVIGDKTMPGGIPWPGHPRRLPDRRNPLLQVPRNGVSRPDPGGQVRLNHHQTPPPGGGDTVAVNSSDRDISTTGVMTGIGAVTTDGLLTAALGATISGATTAINADSNFATNINTVVKRRFDPRRRCGHCSRKFVRSDITTAGVMTGIGAITADGLLTASLGATISGATTAINADSNFATNINTGTSNGALTLGGNSGTVAVNSSDWDITTTGAMTGIGAITSDGAVSTTSTLGVGTWPKMASQTPVVVSAGPIHHADWHAATTHFG